MHKYESILNMTRPVSSKNKMSNIERASQFMPFSALNGYKDVIEEKSRYVEKKIVLTDELIEDINIVINILLNDLDKSINIKYFVPDKVKKGGVYITYTGKILKIDTASLKIYLDNNDVVDTINIVEISII